jgi:hypothetical protein
MRSLVVPVPVGRQEALWGHEGRSLPPISWNLSLTSGERMSVVEGGVGLAATRPTSVGAAIAPLVVDTWVVNEARCDRVLNDPNNLNEIVARRERCCQTRAT